MNKTKIGPQPLALYNNMTVFMRGYFDANIFQKIWQTTKESNRSYTDNKVSELAFGKKNVQDQKTILKDLH